MVTGRGLDAPPALDPHNPASLVIGDVLELPAEILSVGPAITDRAICSLRVSGALLVSPGRVEDGTFVEASELFLMTDLLAAAVAKAEASRESRRRTAELMDAS